MKTTLILLIILFNTYNYWVVISSLWWDNFIEFFLLNFIPCTLLIVSNILFMLYDKCWDFDIKELR